MVKVKTNTKKGKAPSAPSSTSTKKKLAAYEPPKKRKLKPAGKQKVEDEPKTKVDKKKQASTKKAVKKIASYKWGADPKRDKVIHANYMAYLKAHSLPRWGNGELDADSKGMDGADTLRLLTYVSKQIAIKPKRIVDLLLDKPGPKLVEAVVKAATWNIWQWANFCSRLWSDTQNLEPPMRRIVNIDVADLFPGCETPKVLDRYVNLIKDDSDAVQALRNLAMIRYRIRLVFTIKHEYEVSQKTLYKLFDLMHFTASDKSIWGIAVDLSKSDDYSAYPRDVAILKPNDLRKSSEVESYLDEAIDAGYRVILPFDLVQGKATKLKEVKQGPIYSKLCKSWKGLSPLITMPLDSKMVKVAKVSKLSDILLA